MVAALPLQAQDEWGHLTDDEKQREILKCWASEHYFINTYCKIYDPEARRWMPFRLWPFQVRVLDAFADHQLVAALKARQLGLTWLALGFALHAMLFRPIVSVLLFSRRDDEAKYMLSDERLRGMYDHLPDFLKTDSENRDNVKIWTLSNGSSARAFPSTAGDSYTATHVIIDEADLIDDLNRLMRSVKPTIDAGGKLIMISRSDKSRPESEFKKIFRGAQEGINGWYSLFLPWWVRPDRDAQWYAAIRADITHRTGSDDDLKEQYPATPQEAMDPRTLDKRIPPDWINRCCPDEWGEIVTIDVLPPEAPLLEDLTVYELPQRYQKYVAGADCAEGLPNSNDSVTIILHATTGEMVAKLAGKNSPAIHAAYTEQLLRWYNDGMVMPENNNHGHTFIQWFVDNGYEGRVLEGHNGKLGWTSSTLGKVLMYNLAAEMTRNRECIIHDKTTADQLKSIEKSTLRAPEGLLDDHADAFALALEAMVEYEKQAAPPVFIQGEVRR